MTTPLRALLVEDSSTDAKLIVRELMRLGRPVEWVRVQDAEAMRAALATKSWDIVLSDWCMPGFTAPRALEVLKSTALDLPFIIVSGTIGEETAVEAMRAGAHDYVLKDRLGRLIPVVERELREHGGRIARRQAEAALRDSEKRYARLAECGIVGLVIADLERSVHDANDAFLALLGYSREELLSGSFEWPALTPPEWRADDERARARLRASGSVQPREKELLHKDGSRVPVLVATAMLDHPKCIVLVLDLTPQKQAEEALRRSQEQLRHAQKMEAVGRLAGGVAHDFNNLLSVILGYVELLIAELEPSSAMRQDVEEILGAATRAAALTRQLLLFSRQRSSEARVIELNDVLSGMDNMLQRLLGEDVELTCVPSRPLGRVKVDPGHMEQVIMNLVVNARDAMPTGGHLTLETANVLLDEDYATHHFPAKTGDYVMLAVTDTGVGMSKEVQARIFEPFFTTKETGKGTGLGLSTVFGIVQQSGGHLWVYSEPGCGTTFKIYLPRVDEPLDVAVPSMPAVDLRGSETILLVEDEDQVRAIALAILRKYGYRVLPARNALEAVHLCESFPEEIHLLLTDVVMPKISGPELAKRLRSLRPEMRVLCMSGYTDESVWRHGLLGTGMAFLQKPITPSALTRKLREVLEGAGRTSSLG